MASHKKQSEGIALLSMYGDEEEEDDEMEEAEEHRGDPMDDSNEALNAEDDSNYDNGDLIAGFGSGSANNFSPPLQQLTNDNSTPKPLNFRASTPLQSQVSISSPSPKQQAVALEVESKRKRLLTIVDYGHDEVAMSPEAEEGEITTAGRVMFGEELQTIDGDFQERTPGSVRVVTPITQATPPQSFEPDDMLQADVVNYPGNDLESAKFEEAIEVPVEEPKDIDPLDKFLPPPPKAKCSDELQEKIVKFLQLKKKYGRSYNAEVRNKKEYRNPDFLLHAVTFQDIDQIGSCLNQNVFDPHGYDESDYYDVIEKDMKLEMERKEQERKKSQRVEFTSVGTQPGMVIPAPKVNIPLPVASVVASGGLLPVPGTVDVGRDGRQNKKSKWDKVDTDQRNPLSTGGQDSVSAVTAHAALLSAANAGTGYTAFAQQRRREAEEKRHNEKRLERRS